jgi:hypothetical protein
MPKLPSQTRNLYAGNIEVASAAFVNFQTKKDGSEHFR